MKQFKRIIAMIMTVAMCLGLAVTASASNVAADQQQRTHGSDGGAQTSYAETNEFDKYKITIAGGDINKVDGVTQNDHKYRAYQIFAGDVNAGTAGADSTASPAENGRDELAVTGWGKDVDGDALLAALKADTTHFQVQKKDAAGLPLYVDPADPTKTTTVANDNPVMVNAFADATGFAGVASAISKWKDGATTGKEDREKISRMTDYFAEVVAANVKPDLETGGVALTWDGTNNKYVSPDLEEGYYLVKDLGEAAEKDDFISKNIIELLGGDAEIAPKGSIPQVDKGVVDKDSKGIDANTGKTDSSAAPYSATMPDNFVENDAVEANIGDTVYYTLKGTVSNMIQDFTKYEFTFHDKMSKGLSFGTAASAAERSAVATSAQDIEKAITDATTRKDNADTAYNDQHALYYADATSEQDVYDKDDAAILAAETEKNTAEQDVETKQQALDDVNANSTDPAEILAAEQALATAKETLQQKEAALKAAEDAKAEHEAKYQELKAEQTEAQNELTAANNAKTLRTNTINNTASLTPAEKALLLADMPEEPAEVAEPDPTDATKYPAGDTDPQYLADKAAYDQYVADKMTYDRYMEALNKVQAANIQAQKDAGNIKVYLYDESGAKQALIDPSCYDVVVTPGEGIDGGDKLTIKFNDLLTVTGKKADATGAIPDNAASEPLTVKAGDYLVAVYSAVVNEDSIVGNPGNRNEVELEYSRDPDSEDTGKSKSTPNDALVFTFELDINKIDKNSKERLTDAGFFLYKTTNVVVDDGNGNTSNVPHRQYANFIDKGNGVYVFNGWTEPIAIADPFNDAAYTAITTATPVAGTELLTTANGHFEVKGLQSGNYGVLESTVPNGYDPEKRGSTFPMNLQAEFASLTSTEEKECANEFNPNYIDKTTYTAEEQAAGIDKLYVDAWGDPTNDPIARIKNPAHESDATADKWALTVDADGTILTTTNVENDALKQMMTLKTYKVSNLTLNANDQGATAGNTNTENGTGMIDVENSLEVTLPETGGIGTTIFYIVGGILVVGAAVVMITRKRVEG